MAEGETFESNPIQAKEFNDEIKELSKHDPVVLYLWEHPYVPKVIKVSLKSWEIYIGVFIIQCGLLLYSYKLSVKIVKDWKKLDDGRKAGYIIAVLLMMGLSIIAGLLNGLITKFINVVAIIYIIAIIFIKSTI